MFSIRCLLFLILGAVLTFLSARAQNAHAQFDVPITSVPSGYGRYCSISYPSGGWSFSTLSGANSNPCGAAAPGGTIERAGLWSLKGDNNVLVNCGGEIGILRDPGSKPTKEAYDKSEGKKNCIFTVAPTSLPIFGYPYGKFAGPLGSPPSPFGNPSDDVSISRGFDYNVYRLAMNVVDFGQTPNPAHPQAHSVDRKGRQRCKLGTAQECAGLNPPQPAGCEIIPGEPAYDWNMPAKKPILAVAAGIVRDARWRDVSSYPGCGADLQGEVYIEHQVGAHAVYAERFISYYAHMSKISVKTGATVKRGDKIAEAGNTGCSGGNHLHFGVFRLTNLSGHRSYAFQTTPLVYGVNGVHGTIDPFGWAAPKGIDPWAWKFLQYKDDPNSLPSPGAFSIYLWRAGVVIPHEW